MAAIIAGGVNSARRREVLCPGIDASEEEPFWTELSRELKVGGLRGVKRVISDAHLGIMAAVSGLLSSTWHCCRAHFMRNGLATAGKSGRRMVSTFIATAFAKDDAQTVSAQWRGIADHICPKIIKLATLMVTSDHDVVVFMGFPMAHRAKFHSSNPIECLHGEIRRRIQAVGILPTWQGIGCLVGGHPDGAIKGMRRPAGPLQDP